MKKQKKNIEVIARAFILVDNKALLCKMQGENWYFLPGGHVGFEEKVEESLLREIKEEIGISITLQSLIGVIENFYTEKEEKHHEINLIFSATAKKLIPISRESHIEFVLKDVKSLADEPILPAILKPALLEWLKNKKIFWGCNGNEEKRRK